jgi:hypothetical protein
LKSGLSEPVDGRCASAVRGRKPALSDGLPMAGVALKVNAGLAIHPSIDTDESEYGNKLFYKLFAGA